MFCKYCHYEFYVPGDTLGARVRCPNCTATLKVEDKQLLYPCPECKGMLNVDLWMIGSVSTCPHCGREIALSLGEDSYRFFADEGGRRSEMLRSASKKNGDIIGKYRVIRCLGIGGMGEVYLVEHSLLNTKCALKLLKPEIARQDPEMRARLLREARLASQIQHPNLIAVLDAELDEDSGSCYIVMEYVDGVSIENILVDGPMLEERTLQIIAKVAEALHVAAGHKIIHRDIKPANIMLSSSGEVKLADLGIAKVESDNKQNVTLTMDNAVLGTPNYASPEQLRSSHRVDSRADIYSLGATMYHMLTGKRPFEAESVFGVMANVLEKDIPPVRTVNPDVSAGTSELIARMMAKKREERPENFEVLLNELYRGAPKISFKFSWGKLFRKINLGKIITFRNIWSLFLASVAVAGLIVASKLLYAKYTPQNTPYQEEEESTPPFPQRPYRRRSLPGGEAVRYPYHANDYVAERRLINALNSGYADIAMWREAAALMKKKQRYSNDTQQSSRLLLAMETAFAKKKDDGYDLTVRQELLEAVNGVRSSFFEENKRDFVLLADRKLINAIRDENIKQVKEIRKMVAKLDRTGIFMACNDVLEFLRAAIRLDYAKCLQMKNSFKGNPRIESAFYLIFNRVRRYYSSYAERSYTIPIENIRYPEDAELVYCMRHSGFYKEFPGNVSDKMNNLLRHYEENKKRYDEKVDKMRSLGHLTNSPLAMRRFLNKRGAVGVAELFNEQVLEKEIKELPERRSKFFQEHLASIILILEAGYPVSPELLDELRKIPQLDDFVSGEAVPSYDYRPTMGGLQPRADTPAAIKLNLVNKAPEKEISVPAASSGNQDKSADAENNDPQPEEQKRAETPVQIPADPAIKNIDGVIGEFDFGNLNAAQKKNFIPSFLDDGVLKVDGLYPFSREFREKHGANAPHNKISVPDLNHDEFSVSVMFYPQAFKRNFMPVFIGGRGSRWFSMTLYPEKLNVQFNHFRTRFSIPFPPIKLNAWHYCVVSVSVPKKSVIVKFDDHSATYTLPESFEIKNKSEHDFYFYNFASGSAFHGWIKHLQIYNRALNEAEVKQLAHALAAKSDLVKQKMKAAAREEIEEFKSVIEKLKNLSDENHNEEASALARNISRSLINKIKSLVSDNNYDACVDLLKSCAPARSRSIDEWNIISNIFQNEYCNAMKISDNRKIERIYHAWRIADRKNADQVHIVYCAFEYEFLRSNYLFARNVLIRNRDGSKKIQDIMREKIDAAEKYMQNKMVRKFDIACRNNHYWQAKAIVSAMKDMNCDESQIAIFKKRMRRISGERSPKRQVIRDYFSMALRDGDPVFTRLALANGASPRDKVTYFRNDGSGERKKVSETHWNRLLKRVSTEYVGGEMRRLSYISCLLAIHDRRAFSHSEKQDVAGIKELSDFVLKKF